MIRKTFKSDYMKKDSEILKVPEVRALVKNYEKKQLEYLVTELYKILTKAQKEENNISNLISNPDPEDKTPVMKKGESVRPFREIEDETGHFISNAYAQNYLIPNRSISKKERPKWRFVVKKLYKELDKYLQNPDYQVKAAGLLEKLYEVICYSCNYVLFSAYDPFESIGIAQSEFFNTVIEAYDKTLEREAFVDKGIDLIITQSLNRYTLYDELMDVFIHHLKTPDMKYMLIEKSKQKWNYHSVHKPDKKEVISEYKYKNLLNNLTEIAFKGFASLYELDKAVAHFNEFYKEKDREIKLYILIDLLFKLGEKEIILKELSEAEKQKVNMRKSLLNLKEHIITNNNLTKYIN
jgi:hypothetical protein